jgi:hypothetical protein
VQKQGAKALYTSSRGLQEITSSKIANAESGSKIAMQNQEVKSSTEQEMYQV